MMLYLIKSGLCLLVLFVVYKGWLEHEKMLQFNRIYLIVSLVFAFVSPLVSFEIPQTTLPVAEIDNVVPSEIMPVIKPAVGAKVAEAPIRIIPSVLWIYGLVVFILLIRFLNNLLRISQKIKHHQKIHLEETTLVLLPEALPPCTFLWYIFLNEAQYKRGLEREILTHEQTHARQLHSVDVLLVELLIIVFWFNPILYFLKKAVQLNHEFLADNAVNQQFKNVRDYQELLLQKTISNDFVLLTSSLHFQLTKQRLTMMTKTTSVWVATLKKVTLLPIFGVLALISAVSVAQETVKKTSSGNQVNQKQPRLTQQDVNLNNARILITQEKGNRNVLKYDELTEEQKKLLGNPRYFLKDSPTDAMMAEWASSEKFGVWLDDKRIPNSQLKQYKTADIAHFFSSKLYKNAQVGKRRFQIGLMTTKYYDEVYIKSVKDAPRFMIDLREKPSK